ncbi:hypothetical protein DSO57_1007443 [Entomophthora muscae]|uniref:Uncharacterized protein n=1 Tax=Entomophthora muscae TaxID=34485 RepID=A0ACC2U5W1_9FUNG|nr:hypothetical protein DSO57_1007443 [Entomophthora muscae]
MFYPFCFQSYTGSALLDSGADCTLINSNFVTKFRLNTNPLQIRNVVLAYEHHIAVTWEIAPFSITLENLHSTIQGPIIDLSRFNMVLGLDWLQKNNPNIDRATSILTLKQEGVNHKIYPDTVDQLLWDHVFVHITETQEEKVNLKAIDWDSFQYKCEVTVHQSPLCVLGHSKGPARVKQ